MYNTPNTWGVYIVKLVTEWVESIGGLEALEQRMDAEPAEQGHYELKQSKDAGDGAGSSAFHMRFSKPVCQRDGESVHGQAQAQQSAVGKKPYGIQCNHSADRIPQTEREKARVARNACAMFAIVAHSRHERLARIGC